ncbi:MAG: hypothetical protein ACK5JH_11550 [Anaerocolumna sp.]
MTEKNKESSKTVLKSIGQNFKKSKIAFKVGFVANCLAVLAFILCLFRIFSLYAIITFGVCTLIAFFAYGVLLIDTLNHRTK